VNDSREYPRIRTDRLILDEEVGLAGQQPGMGAEHNVNPTRRNDYPTAGRRTDIKDVKRRHRGGNLGDRSIVQLRPPRNANRLVRNRHIRAQDNVCPAVVRIQKPAHVRSRVRHLFGHAHEHTGDEDITINSKRIAHATPVQDNVSNRKVRPLRARNRSETRTRCFQFIR